MLSEIEENNKIISELILVGRSDESSQQSYLENINYSSEYNCIVRQGSRFWVNLANNLNIKDLESLIKGLTIFEKQPGCSGGSVSGVIGLYELYEKKYIPENSNLGDWILVNTDNYYLPFGTDNRGAVSVKEYFENKNRRYTEQNKREFKDQEDSKQRKTIRSERIILYNKLHQEKAIERRKYINTFNNMDKLEQLKVIAFDKTRPIGYYPIKCASFGNEILKKLGKRERNLLIDRLSDRRKGEWAIFYKRLMGIIE